MKIKDPNAYVFVPPVAYISSKEELVRTEFQAFVSRYVKATGSYWKKIPVYYMAYVHFIVNRFQPLRKSLSQLLGYMYIGVIKKRQKRADIPPCDVILYYSTPKTIWQIAMDALAERLAKKGYRVALINNKNTEILSCGEKDNRVMRQVIENLVTAADFGSSRMKSLSNIIRSFGNVIRLPLLLRHDVGLFRELFRNPFLLWTEFFFRYQYLDFCNELVKQVRPCLIINNHIVLRFGAELMASEESKKVHRVWFCNENPAGVYIPPDVCDEIWFWNQVHYESHRLLMMPGANIQVEIIGHAESDVALNSGDSLLKTDEELDLQKKIEGKKALLFLSTYYPPVNGINRMSDPISRELSDWLYNLSSRHPDWFFIYKARPTRFGEMPPGFDVLKNMQNWLFPQMEINFLNLLNWDNIVAVAADSSLGLIAAAGMTKLPIWLSPPSQEYHFLPNLEQVSIHVNSSDELDEVITNFDELYPAYLQWLKSKENEIFPYRENVLGRMEELCLKRLAGK